MLCLALPMIWKIADVQYRVLLLTPSCIIIRLVVVVFVVAAAIVTKWEVFNCWLGLAVQWWHFCIAFFALLQVVHVFKDFSTILRCRLLQSISVFIISMHLGNTKEHRRYQTGNQNICSCYCDFTRIIVVCVLCSDQCNDGVVSVLKMAWRATARVVCSVQLVGTLHSPNTVLSLMTVVLWAVTTVIVISVYQTAIKQEKVTDNSVAAAIVFMLCWHMPHLSLHS